MSPIPYTGGQFERVDLASTNNHLMRIDENIHVLEYPPSMPPPPLRGVLEAPDYAIYHHGRMARCPFRSYDNPPLQHFPFRKVSWAPDAPRYIKIALDGGRTAKAMVVAMDSRMQCAASDSLHGAFS